MAVRIVALLMVAVPTRAFTSYVRYFAFGSNLDPSVFEGLRGMTPLAVSPGIVRDHRLAFNLRGTSRLEPAFASCEPAPGEMLHGVCFDLTLRDFAVLCASEGIPVSYELRTVRVDLYGPSVRSKVGSVDALTLQTTRLWRMSSEPPPSARYLELIRQGARKRGLSQSWVERLDRIVPATTPAPFGRMLNK